VFKGDLYFSAEAPETGGELWKLEAGSTTPTPIDIIPGEAGSFPSQFFVL
jgi:ELWxxDGT repeat protein